MAFSLTALLLVPFRRSRASRRTRIGPGTCPDRHCAHCAAIPLWPTVACFGSDVSNDRLRTALRCSAFVIAELREGDDFPLASYQPKFVIDQVRAACKW
jgi:hypothetical protein